MQAKRKRKLRRVLTVYGVTAFAVLALLAALYASRVWTYRTAARYSYELSFEETAAAVNALSETLEKSRYATGELCHALASEAYAEACAAKAALSTLPFSTVEMEQTKSFLGTACGFLRGLCAKSGEFADDERADVLALSDTAAAYTALLLDMRAALTRGELEMDSREKRLENVTDGDAPAKLSERFAEAEEDFPALAELKSYRGPDGPALPRYADTERAKAAAAKLLGISPELLREECVYADGTVGLGRDTLFIRADAEKVLSIEDSRLVGSGEVSEKRAAAKARDFLSAAGYAEMQESGRRRSGNVLVLSFVALAGDALCPDCSAEVGIALDNCALYSYRAPRAMSGGELSWPLSAEDAQAALPSELAPLGWRRLVLDDQPCYEYRCVDGEREVRITVDAQYARELSIEVARA